MAGDTELVTPRPTSTDDPRDLDAAAGSAVPLPEQALLRIVTENARVGLVIVSADRRYVYANATYGEILDLPVSGLVGQRLEDVLAGVYQEQVRPCLDRAFAGERVGYELRKPTADGDRYFSVRYEPTEVEGSVALVVVVITDIIERRQTQVDSSRLAAIVESSDDAIVSKDLDGIVTSWNQGAERMFGYSAAEMVGTSIRRLIPADRQDEEAHILEKIRRGERVQHFETLRRTKDGRTISVSVAASPIKDATGTVIGASKVARDISARKRAEEDARFQQTMLMTERELTLDGILVVDDQSQVLSYNGRFAEMWGISADILSARADAALLQAVRDKLLDPERFMERVRHLYDRHDEASHDEVELTDGRVFDRYSAPIRTSDGRYYGRVWYFRDVTERKQAIEALREEQDRAQRYLDTADVILLALNDAGRITLVNRKGCDLLGWTEAELLGRDWIETCLPPRVRQGLTQKLANLMEGDLSAVENPILTKKGRERLIEWRNQVLRDGAGRVIGTLSSGADVTERRSLEEQYHQARKMDAIGRLAAGVAHDFNNLLTAILGHCGLLLADLAPNDPSREDIQGIQAAGERAATLTRQLLAFSRKQIIEPKLLDLNAVIGNMRKMLERLIGEDVTIALRLAPELGAVKADDGQTEQIVLNLAVNARDAMPNGGTLTIETGNVELDEDDPRAGGSVKRGPYVALTVSDTGTGMSPEVQARLFEPFFTTKEAGKGTGLGLATVSGIATRGGGGVSVESELGKGTSFTVYFPRVPRGEVVTEAPLPVARKASAGETVLVVEDADELRELAKRMLERDSYTVLLAANAKEALEVFERKASIDVIVTDVVMPGGSGPELTKRLIAQRPGLKVIYMSGYTEDAITHHGVLDPGIVFLHKPFTAESLGRKIREVLDR